MPKRYVPTLVATLTSLWLPASLEASTFHCAAEDVACLIAAINMSNSNGEPENTIRLAPGTYTLTAVDNTTQAPNGLPAITSALTILAEIDGSEVRIVRPPTAPPFRFFYAGSGARLTLDGITLTGGGGTFFGAGGALYSAGAEITLAHATVVGNRASTGAAIYSDNGTLTLSDTRINDNPLQYSAVRTRGGRVTVVRSEFARNRPGEAGGVLAISAPELLWMEDTRLANNSVLHESGGLLLEGGTAVLNRVTFERNSNDGSGAAILRDATVVIRESTFFENFDVFGTTLWASGTSKVDIVNSTFVGNLAQGGEIASGAVIRNTSPSVTTVVNSTFAGNRSAFAVFVGNVSVQNTIVQHALVPPPPPPVLCTGQVLSLGHNLFDGPGATCKVVLHPTDVIGAAGLGTFADTGQPGGGHVPLLAESVAIDAAEASACPAKDQLGRSRTSPCDIGAVEYSGSISASPASVAPGAAVTASWSGIGAPTANDWIGLYVPGAGDRAYLTWIYVSCTDTPAAPAASGSCPLVVPSDLPNGTYELRLFANGGTGVYTRLAISNPFTVATGGGGEPTISASPATVAPGAAVTASWSGIGAPTANDWIALYVPGTVDQAYLTWIYVSCTTTPDDPAASGSCHLVVPSGLPSGTYELRLLANGGSGVYTRLAISNPFTVGAGGGGPTVSASPATVAPGAAVTASWSGIVAPTPNDWVALYVPGSIHEAYLTWVYVSCTSTPGQAASSGSCPVVVPATLPAGSYEIRLFSNGGTGIYTPLATSNLIAVQ